MLDYLKHKAFEYRELVDEASTRRGWEYYMDLLEFTRAEIKRLSA